MEKEVKGWNHPGILGHRWINLVTRLVSGGIGIFIRLGWHG